VTENTGPESGGPRVIKGRQMKVKCRDRKYLTAMAELLVYLQLYISSKSMEPSPRCYSVIFACFSVLKRCDVSA